jgi:surface antigen
VLFRSEKDEASTYLDEAMQDMGIPTDSGSSTANSEFNPDTIQADFQATGCAYGAYTVSSNGCTTIPQWFIGEYTSLTASNGHGWAVASNLAAANNISTSTTPVAPAIFSTSTSSSTCLGYGTGCAPNGSYGHTGLVYKVEGDTVYTLETGADKGDDNPCSFTATYKLSDRSDMTYVNLGGYLK